MLLLNQQFLAQTFMTRIVHFHSKKLEKVPLFECLIQDSYNLKAFKSSKQHIWINSSDQPLFRYLNNAKVINQFKILFFK